MRNRAAGESGKADVEVSDVSLVSALPRSAPDMAGDEGASCGSMPSSTQDVRASYEVVLFAFNHLGFSASMRGPELRAHVLSLPVYLCTPRSRRHQTEQGVKFANVPYVLKRRA